MLAGAMLIKESEKRILDPSLYPDTCKKLMGSILGFKEIWLVVFVLSCRQPTDKRTRGGHITFVWRR